MKIWAALGSFGKLWEVLGSFGKFWAALGSFGLLWAVLGNFKQLQVGLKPAILVIIIALSVCNFSGIFCPNILY